MAQKDKIKELVGRGLHSYHTKSLQQIDRIEKKNKEQNHKISILSNELDNDYLTKTEEGSVVSLEHSKEGMVYLDELQGNTLVNYCTDGSKELTLNGDIDLEGTFVTTTEGVDNGKVDVMCEGNTLVNKLYKIKNYGSEFGKHGWGNSPNCSKFEWIDNGIKMYALSSDTRLDRYYRSSPDKYGIFKKNRTYVVRMNVNSNDLQQNATILRCFYGNGTVFMNGQMSEVVNGVFIKKATTSSTIEEVDAIHSMISLDYRTLQGVDGWVSFQNVMVIDVTDLPSYQQDVEYWRNIEYFEGMKSVGQDDENGHKIEILSAKGKENLFKNSGFLDGTTYCHFHNGAIGEVVNEDSSVSKKALKFTTGVNGLSGLYKYQIIPNIDNAKYTISGWCKGEIDTTLQIHIERHKRINIVFENEEWTRFEITSEKNPTNWNRTVTFYSVNNNKVFYLKDIKAEKSDFATPYIPHTTESNYSSFINKKEILLNEPLRGLPNGVKDRFVKIGGKPYIERNCGYIFLDNTRNWKYNTGHNNPIFECSIKNDIVLTSDIIGDRLLCDKLESKAIYSNNENYGICFVNGSFCRIRINGYTTSEEYNNWINNNSLNVVYQLPTPVYEPLEIDSTLSCYSEVTHFSNNSIIPCNMKIKNTGYNAIIKPSTLYTVALDTNKSGTIGMNLGGVKGTTTNNVLTLTTPATLTDDSLRIYGKGIKGSKVRLLEGDKTNWIPSFFEGMKSCFEDRVQEDGTYKMEILMNNENLIPIPNDYVESSQSKALIENPSIYNELAKNLNGKTVTVSAYVKGENIQPIEGMSTHYGLDVKFKGGGNKFASGSIWLSLTKGILPHSGSFEGRYSATVTFGDETHISGFNGVDLFLRNMTGKLTMKDITITVQNSKQFIPHKFNKIQFSSIEPLRGVDNIKDKFVFKDGKLMIERNCSKYTTVGTENWLRHDYSNSNKIFAYAHVTSMNDRKAYTNIYCNNFATYLKSAEELKKQNNEYIWKGNDAHSALWLWISNNKFDGVSDINKFKTWIKNNPITVTYQLAEPIYEEIPFELQKIILEGYENGTLFFDTNIPPTSTVTYAGETPIVKSVKLNKTEVLNNTTDINDNIIPYLMDMDYRVVCLELATETQGISMARLFGGVYEMLKRDILSKRYSVEEYKYRLDAYLSVNKITEKEYEELGEMLNE